MKRNLSSLATKVASDDRFLSRKIFDKIHYISNIQNQLSSFKNKSETNMVDEVQSEYEKRLILEIGRIDDQIRGLNLEKIALQRLLARAKRANINANETGRKNSGARIITETCVVRALKEKGRAMSLHALYKEAQEFNFDLKSATFRCQLHRMKKKGMIVSAGRNMWKLPPQNSN